MFFPKKETQDKHFGLCSDFGWFRTLNDKRLLQICLLATYTLQSIYFFSFGPKRAGGWGWGGGSRRADKIFAIYFQKNENLMHIFFWEIGWKYKLFVCFNCAVTLIANRKPGVKVFVPSFCEPIGTVGGPIRPTHWTQSIATNHGRDESIQTGRRTEGRGPSGNPLVKKPSDWAKRRRSWSSIEPT